MIDSNLEILIAVGLVPVALEIFNFIKTRIREYTYNSNNFTKIFDDIHTIYYTLLVILRESSAKRIAIYKTTNGGGKPKLSGRLHNTVIYEAFEKPLGSIRNKWKYQELDESYMSLLYEMNKTGAIIVSTNKLNPSILKTFYAHDKIKYTLIYKIAERKEEYIYLTISFLDEIDSDLGTSDLLRIAINNLRVLFTKNPKI